MAGGLQVPSKIDETQTKLTRKNETQERRLPLVESLEASFSQTHENGLVSQPLLPSSNARLAGPWRAQPSFYSEG